MIQAVTKRQTHFAPEFERYSADFSSSTPERLRSSRGTESTASGGSSVCSSTATSRETISRTDELMTDESPTECSGNSSTLTNLPSQILETIDGRVTEVCGAIAFVQLRTNDGSEYIGQYSAEELRRSGIDTGDAFTCEVLDVPGGIIQLRFQRAEPEVLTEEALNALDNQISILLQGFDDDNDEAIR